MLATGIGEILAPLSRFPELALVLVVPPVGVDTAWAYASALPAEAKQPVGSGGLQGRLPALSAADLPLSRDGLLSRLSNDFEARVAAHYPDIARVRSRLADLGAIRTVMSGSGSAVVGVFDGLAVAECAARGFDDGDRAFAARVLRRHPPIKRTPGRDAERV
jgi:4-diphosphocytidyl-2-C-methyl-D-erythritol kinase